MTPLQYIQFWYHAVSNTRTTILFRPSIYAINFAELKDRYSIKALFFDYDDTLLPFKELSLPHRTMGLLKKLNKSGFKLVIVSNCVEKRKPLLVATFADLPVTIIGNAHKPSTYGFIEALKIVQVDANHACMIGDHASTDLGGAFAAGLQCGILVKSYSKLFGGNRSDIISRTVLQIESYLFRFMYERKVTVK